VRSPVPIAHFADNPEDGVIRLIFQRADEFAEQLGAFTNYGLKFGGNFSGHSQQQVRVERQLTREHGHSGFTWRRFQAALDLGQVRRLNSDAAGNLSQRISAGICGSQFAAVSAQECRKPR
jgi:hypothetical protein